MPSGVMIASGHHWVRLLVTALFVASAVLLLGRWLTPLEMAARLVVVHGAASNAAAQGGARPTTAVLELDRDWFERLHGGRLPLDRCQLLRDVFQALNHLPHVREVALDLDLSPLPTCRDDCTADAAGDDRPCPFSKVNDDQNACGEAVLDFLVGWASQDPTEARRVALILPVDATARASTKWRATLAARPLLLADPRVVREYGLVYRHWDNPTACPTLGQVLNAATREASPGTPRPGQCLPPPSYTAGRQQQCRDVSKDLRELDADAAGERHISFHKAVSGLWVPGLDAQGRLQRWDEQIQRVAALDPAVQRLFIGARFDESDDFLTPLGAMAGVEVHAAVALNPDEHASHQIGFWIDVALGVLLGAGVSYLWGRFFRQRLSRRCATSQTAYVWLVGLGLGWMAVLWGLLLFSDWALVSREVWISPAPMLLGMTLDVLVLGSVEGAIDRLNARNGALHEQTVAAWPEPIPRLWRLVLARVRPSSTSSGARESTAAYGGARRVVALVPTGVWWGVVVLGQCKLWHALPEFLDWLA